MDALLLGQYSDSPNLREFILCFIAEMDTLLAECEAVYLGRFLENAVGAQLDVVGIIIDESRSVELPTFFFGTSDNGVVDPAINVADPSFANESTPFNGGLFFDGNGLSYSVTPLDDSAYRRLLTAKASLHVKKASSLEVAYGSLYRLLGRIPSKLELTQADNSVTCTLSASDTNLGDQQFVEYFSRYLVPLGTSFNVLRI